MEKNLNELKKVKELLDKDCKNFFLSISLNELETSIESICMNISDSVQQIDVVKFRMDIYKKKTEKLSQELKGYHKILAESKGACEALINFYSFKTRQCTKDIDEFNMLLDGEKQTLGLEEQYMETLKEEYKIAKSVFTSRYGEKRFNIFTKRPRGDDCLNHENEQ